MSEIGPPPDSWWRRWCRRHIVDDSPPFTADEAERWRARAERLIGEVRDD